MQKLKLCVFSTILSSEIFLTFFNGGFEPPKLPLWLRHWLTVGLIAACEDVAPSSVRCLWVVTVVWRSTDGCRWNDHERFCGSYVMTRFHDMSTGNFVVYFGVQISLQFGGESADICWLQMHQAQPLFCCYCTLWTHVTFSDNFTIYMAKCQFIDTVNHTRVSVFMYITQFLSMEPFVSY